MLYSPHFDSSEFVCPCCGRGADKISPRLIELLEALRADAGGFPIYINSGYRCPIHNREVGGVANSQHLFGTAADLAVPPQVHFRDFLWYVERQPFDWVGVYPLYNMIHVDVRAGGDDDPPTVDWMQ